MIYKQFKDLKISQLGFGCMRLPTIEGVDANIDESATSRMVEAAFDAGINYFDTAWGYHEGNSEPVMGKILKQYPRDSFYLATKFPGYDVSNLEKIEEIFFRQLENLQTEYFDFYLIHNVIEINIDAYLKPDLMNFLREQKRLGKIHYLGFSIHGSLEVLKRFLDAYGAEMEFCQVQLNWFDYGFQDAQAKLDLLKAYHLPVIVMEPLRGGKLSSLSDESAEKLHTLRPETSAVEWAFRYLQGFDEVFLILSGMSNQAQLEENLHVFKTNKPTTPEENTVLYEIAETLRTGVSCTACRYCTTSCPMELDIPRLLYLYNEHLYAGGGFLSRMTYTLIPEDKPPSACISCGKCEELCPQGITVSLALKEFAEMMKKE